MKILLIALLLTCSSYAGEPPVLIVQVKGVVCAFCAQGLKKNFNKRPEVQNTRVNMDTMEVTLTLVAGKTLSKETIEKVVVGAGFAFKGIKR